MYHSPFPEVDQLTVYTDSQYAFRLQGDALPVTHHQLVTVAQKYYTAVRCKYRTIILKVSSHTGIPGNEQADTFAKRGVTSRSALGRFSSVPPQPLSPPTIDFNHAQWAEGGCHSPRPSLVPLLSRGKLVSSSQRAKTFAGYLANKI